MQKVFIKHIYVWQKITYLDYINQSILRIQFYILQFNIKKYRNILESKQKTWMHLWIFVFKEAIWIKKQPHEKSSVSFSIREIQLKTTMWYQNTLKKLKVKKPEQMKCWWGCRSNKTFLLSYFECDIIKTCFQFFKKVQYKVTMCPFHSTPRYLPKLMYVHIEFYTTLTAAKLLTAPNWKEFKGSSTGKWIKNQWYIHTMQYYSSI